jgi:acyl-CoA synthetase (AMP-forming)/AMP-acid ligase II
LTQSLHRSVQQRPNAVATLFGQRTQTFTQQRTRVARVAGGLQALGVAPGERVAYLGLNSDRFSEYYLAVPWADAVVNPVNIRWAPPEIAYSLADSETRVMMVDDTFVPMVEQIGEHYDGLDVLIYVGDGATPDKMVSYEDLVATGPEIEDVRRSGDSLAGLFYTGGTTGFPKGVMLSHTNLVSSALGAIASGVYPAERTPTLHASPMFHLAALAVWVTSTIAGGTHVIIPSFDPIAVFEAVQEHRIEGLRLIPIMIQMLVDHPEFDDYDLSSVTTIGYGGSSISEALLVRAAAKFPGVGFTQAFGQTELSPITSLLGPEGHSALARETGLIRSAGIAAPHAEIRIVDENDAEVPRGVVGEIVAHGPHVMLGYWNKPEETAAALRGGWMHTGDAGWMDDNGYLYVVDRIKDMIITGGENVYSTEVENAVASHPAVAACAVIGVPDERWGERVHAVVVVHAGARVGAEDLRVHAKGLIAGYKCPRTIDFVEELPATSTGKILKRDLRTQRDGVL